ncbi:MAG: cysteine peptidase family C39 domain-containing protein [Acidobacteriota bacterium]|nr:cysteine peptidase family C39 domain-containing protein [Acidobacteriota bacterium]
MVLASYKFEISETELRNLCECDETGTSPSNAVKAVIECGFQAYRAELSFEELEDLLRRNITPIVFTRVSQNTHYSHAVIVYKITKEKVFVLDPTNGEQEFRINDFVEIWSRGLTIIVEKRNS